MIVENATTYNIHTKLCSDKNMSGNEVEIRKEKDRNITSSFMYRRKFINWITVYTLRLRIIKLTNEYTTKNIGLIINAKKMEDIVLKKIWRKKR